MAKKIKVVDESIQAELPVQEEVPAGCVPTPKGQITPREAARLLADVSVGTAEVAPDVSGVAAYLGLLIVRQDVEAIQRLAQAIEIMITLDGGFDKLVECVGCDVEDCPDRH